MKPHKDLINWKKIETIALPVVLLFTGLVLIGGDRVGVLSLDRVQNLWPMALILVGLSDLLTGSEEASRTELRTSQISRSGARHER